MAGAFLADRLGDLGADQEPGDRLHRLGQHLLPAGDERARAGAQRAARLDAGFVVSAVSSLSFLSHFDRISKGVLELPGIVFYVSLMVFALFANRIFVELKKAD
jgi:hypothetical protein